MVAHTSRAYAQCGDKLQQSILLLAVFAPALSAASLQVDSRHPADQLSGRLTPRASAAHLKIDTLLLWASIARKLAGPSPRATHSSARRMDLWVIRRCTLPSAFNTSAPAHNLTKFLRGCKI